ncbi:hypothetical protein TWF225_010443 [Orbilia oligospora]|uniref:Uncharacterized protein n=1 Tax=Orbilia oligospora TaxID=2813651 RepID=A0A7C8KDM8_ORBOL|nr:hypothetical protein TWF751_006797 [Orbilia oligospora]KAF3172050.1 hypothetical protein TWF225_010443 [Orbilia oligospora]KAF3237278.1 hypothetical protein TWF217_002164 [Orbilia oligospora]KAF3255521.1 hypothetical protein TWF128_005525 [Orbilia oligospora]KAF3297483.1 hypothetical protein TWF132_007571 [Orbilia oligospora]
MEAAFWNEFYRRILRSYSISLNTNLFFATRGDYLRNRDLAYEFDNIPVPCFVFLWEYATSLRIVNAADKDVEKKVRDLIERTAKISPDTTVLPTATRITEALASTCLCTPTQYPGIEKREILNQPPHLPLPLPLPQNGPGVGFSSHHRVFHAGEHGRWNCSFNTRPGDGQWVCSLEPHEHENFR